jgi:hypothetical protein
MSSELKATPGQLAELKLLVPGIEKRINEFQMDTLATNLDHIVMRDVTVRVFLAHLVSVARATEHDLVDVVRNINMAKLGPKMQAQMFEQIALHGYVVQPIFCADKPAYAYTIGLTNEIGFELFAHAGSDPSLLANVVRHYAELAKRHEHIEHERNDAAAMRHRPKQGVRTLAVPVEALVAKQEFLRQTVGEPVKRVYQILIADADNRLPGESGYDKEAWPQPRLPRPILGD